MPGISDGRNKIHVGITIKRWRVKDEEGILFSTFLAKGKETKAVPNTYTFTFYLLNK